MEAKAVAKYLRISPRKVRLVADIVRGKRVADALTILRFTPKKGARLVHKTLQSAVANAENTNSMDMDSLVISKIVVDEGPMLKRWRPRAMGRANRILKRTSHVTVVLADD
jgi:large subunit ribosomal protein L22